MGWGMRKRGENPPLPRSRDRGRKPLGKAYNLPRSGARGFKSEGCLSGLPRIPLVATGHWVSQELIKSS